MCALRVQKDISHGKELFVKFMFAMPLKRCQSQRFEQLNGMALLSISINISLRSEGCFLHERHKYIVWPMSIRPHSTHQQQRATYFHCLADGKWCTLISCFSGTLHFIALWMPNSWMMATWNGVRFGCSRFLFGWLMCWHGSRVGDGGGLAGWLAACIKNLDHLGMTV